LASLKVLIPQRDWIDVVVFGWGEREMGVDKERDRGDLIENHAVAS
jgi:hypothetical protein